jgi:uncharacterized protein
MTPEERNLVTDLFDRLATLEDAQRDPDAERLIRDGLRQAPNAMYALVQTVLVQDQALRQADAHIRELEGADAGAERDSSFLGGMRDSVFGRRTARGSVPSVRATEAVGEASPAWQGTSAAPRFGSGPAGGMGGSFLGTAAAAAAGVIGGSLLLGGIRSAMAGQPGAHGALDPQAGGGGSSPWGSGGPETELSRQAGLDDIGASRATAAKDEGGGSGGYGIADDPGGEEGSEDDWGGVDGGGFDGGDE